MEHNEHPDAERARRGHHRRRSGRSSPVIAGPGRAWSSSAAAAGLRLDQRRPRLGLFPLLHRPDPVRRPAPASCTRPCSARRQEHARSSSTASSSSACCRCCCPRWSTCWRSSSWACTSPRRSTSPCSWSSWASFRWLKSVIAAAVRRSSLFFFMFEVWFKVPLYKGTLDPLQFLGY